MPDGSPTRSPLTARRRPLPAGLLLRLRASPAGYWLLACALAGLAGLVVSGAVDAAAATRRRLGTTVSVYVTTRAVVAGDVLDDGDLRRADVPVAFLPDATVVEEPVGHAPLVGLLPGEVVVEEKLAPYGRKGVAAVLPAGARAVAVPVGTVRPPLEVGDRVDVLASFTSDHEPVDGGGAAPEPEDGEDPDDDDDEGSGAVEGDPPPTFPVAVAALVLDVGDDVVTVAVTPAESPRVAYAVAAGTVALALVGG